MVCGSPCLDSSICDDSEVVVREVETILFPCRALDRFGRSLETDRYFQNRAAFELPTSSFPEELQMRRADVTGLTPRNVPVHLVVERAICAPSLQSIHGWLCEYGLSVPSSWSRMRHCISLRRLLHGKARLFYRCKRRWESLSCPVRL